MTDPATLSYSRRLYHKEFTELNIIKISEDYMFDFGLYFTNELNPEALEVPESIGRFMT